MKKLLVIICLMYISGLTLKAQNTELKALNTETDPRVKIAFGVKAGLNYSNVWDEKGKDFTADPKYGFAGGVFMGIPIGKFLGVQPEVLISQKGLKASGTLLELPYSFSRTSTFVDIPLQLQVKPVEFLTVVFGPQYSYLLKENNDFTFGSNSIAQEQQFKNDNIRKNILGFVGGADVIISHLVISGRIGFDFQTNNGDGTSSTPRYKNQWLQLTAGFKL